MNIVNKNLLIAPLACLFSLFKLLEKRPILSLKRKINALVFFS